MAKQNMTERRFAESQLYQDVFKACEESLELFGQFNKLQIMKHCGNEALIDAMHWDYIIRKIKAGNNMPGGEVHLIPVAESFFKAKAKEKAEMHTDVSFPGKYVAQGYGKRTAGWVLGTYAEGRFALYAVRLAASQAKGRTNHTQKMGKAVVKQLVKTGETDKVAAIAHAAGIKAPLMVSK